MLLKRLQVRQAEIEQAVLARARSVSDPSKVEDPEYMTGLRRAVRTALGHAIAVLEGGDSQAEAIPAELIAQARVAARNGVSLDTVLRRYFAGYIVLGEFIMREATECPMGNSTLQPMLGAQAALLDRIVVVVSTEYAAEVDRQRRPPALRQVERVEALLAGEPVDTAELPYDLNGWHLGAIVSGHGAARCVRELATAWDRRVLAIERDETTIWAWLGGCRKFEVEKLGAIGRRRLPVGVTLVLGEPGRGIEGWRLTHQQARAVLPIARYNGDSVTRYSAVSLLASALQDEVLSLSLKGLYLTPLAEERDGGATFRETLRSYFACNRNSTSAAAALGVTRQTVNNRLRIIEQRLDCEIVACAVELDLALRLEEIGELRAGVASTHDAQNGDRTLLSV